MRGSRAERRAERLLQVSQWVRRRHTHQVAIKRSMLTVEFTGAVRKHFRASVLSSVFGMRRTSVIPGLQTALTLRSPRPTEGRFARRSCCGTRGGVPRAWFAAKRSGGAGASPGSTTRPCQELADDRKVYTKRLRSPCAKDSKCQAWTYVQPGVQGPKARCWLKASVPPAHPNTCCISEVMERGDLNVH